MSRCLFCDNEADSREHLFPDWLNKVIPIGSPTTFLRGESGNPAILGWQKSKPASHRIKVVCTTCNTGWMSNRLENPAIPVLTPLILGHERDLSIDDQKIIATWAFARAVIGEHLDPAGAAIPETQRHWLRDHLEPPENVRVFIAATDGHWQAGAPALGNVHYSANKMAIDHDQTHVQEGMTAGRLLGYQASILMRHLALQVVGSIIDKAEFAHDAALNAYTAQIWPIEGPIHWPPGPVFTSPTLERFLGAYMGSAPPEKKRHLPTAAEFAAIATRPNRKARRAAERARRKGPQPPTS